MYCLFYCCLNINVTFSCPPPLLPSKKKRFLWHLKLDWICYCVCLFYCCLNISMYIFHQWIHAYGLLIFLGTNYFHFCERGFLFLSKLFCPLSGENKNIMHQYHLFPICILYILKKKKCFTVISTRNIISNHSLQQTRKWPVPYYNWDSLFISLFLYRSLCKSF